MALQTTFHGVEVVEETGHEHDAQAAVTRLTITTIGGVVILLTGTGTKYRGHSETEATEVPTATVRGVGMTDVTVLDRVEGMFRQTVTRTTEIQASTAVERLRHVARARDSI
jgi:hypothetical protein